MRRAAIVAPVRTGVGAFGGSLRDVPVEDLAATVIRAVVDRSGVDPQRVDDVVFAQSYANSEVPCIGRWAALHAGLPITVPGMQLDRRCGGGLQALATAAMMVQSGAAEVVLAGGAESMSRIEYYSTTNRWGARAGSVMMYDRLDRGRERSQPKGRFGRISGMVETAENLAREFAIAREDADAYAARSHALAHAAWEAGVFDDEVVPVEVRPRKGAPIQFRSDEGIRPGTSRETLAVLPTIVSGGTVTAGNASQQNDAAAACLVVAEDQLEVLGLTPMGFIDGWTAVGCEPAKMGIGPVPAVERLAARRGVTPRKLLDSVSIIELNEAFATQVLAVLKGWKLEDHSRVNVNGSGISLGHPIAATGMRMTTTALHELARRGGGTALVTMCIGGGQGMAALLTSS